MKKPLWKPAVCGFERFYFVSHCIVFCKPVSLLLIGRFHPESQFPVPDRLYRLRSFSSLSEHHPEAGSFLHRSQIPESESAPLWSQRKSSFLRRSSGSQRRSLRQNLRGSAFTPVQTIEDDPRYCCGHSPASQYYSKICSFFLPCSSPPRVILEQFVLNFNRTIRSKL